MLGAGVDTVTKVLTKSFRNIWIVHTISGWSKGFTVKLSRMTTFKIQITVMGYLFYLSIAK